MPYRIIPQRIPKERREEINNKILYVIDTHSPKLTPEVIYNCYTGKGGLHGLDAKDFKNYHEFSEAKKEIEAGQFFTPHEVAKKVCEIIQPDENDLVADACCGMGNFFNFLPEQKNIWGNDLDPNATKVAKFLYPEANICTGDIRSWMPDTKFTILLGNPPFGLHFDWQGEDCLSQMYYCLKAHDLLDSAGLLALVMPSSFLADAFWNKSDVAKIDERFTFIGQTALPKDTFKDLGVECYETKIMLFHKRSDHMAHTGYSADMCTEQELAARVSDYRSRRKAVKMDLVREALTTSDKEKESVMYEIRKCLYQIKVHPRISKYHEKCLEYIEKYRTQKPPVGATNDEWKAWERTKITPEKILSYCRRILRSQNSRPKNEIHLICDKRGVRLKGYSKKTRKEVSDFNAPSFSRIHLVGSNLSAADAVPKELRNALRSEIKGADSRIRRERREYELQMTRISALQPTDELREYLDSVVFINVQKEECHLTDLQKEDLGRVMQKRYALLNWQQGSGKTAAAFFYGRRLLETGKVRNVFVLAPALAVNLTWIPFLTNNSVPFVNIKTKKDIESVTDGLFVVVSISMIGPLKRELMELTRKTLKNKACLLFDESDEITNPSSKRTKATLDIFRRLRYKLLCTGTTTRNNIGELYSQIELLYNNSCNMTNWCRCRYRYNKDGELECEDNPGYGRPFPPRGGSVQFNQCFCPGKTTVFGIEKFNQDVYNADELREISGYTITTRKFEEFAGKKYSIDNVKVNPSDAEMKVYDKIMNELQTIAPLYFRETGDARKDAALRMIRTIQLLIKSCSTPHLMPGYDSGELPTKTKKVLDMLEEKPDEKVVVGCTTIEALETYASAVGERFPFRPLYVIDGAISFSRRDRMLKDFELTTNGIVICTQQSLKSSVNIPTCNEMIIEALQWNIPKIQQFFFRAIRFDSKEWTNVHFVTYDRTIEQNIMALLMTKERLNDFLKTGEVKNQNDMLEEYGLSDDLLSALLGKQYDQDGKVYFTWGRQSISA